MCRMKTGKGYDYKGCPLKDVMEYFILNLHHILLVAHLHPHLLTAPTALSAINSPR